MKSRISIEKIQVVDGVQVPSEAALACSKKWLINSLPQGLELSKIFSKSSILWRPASPATSTRLSRFKTPCITPPRLLATCNQYCTDGDESTKAESEVTLISTSPL